MFKPRFEFVLRTYLATRSEGHVLSLFEKDNPDLGRFMNELQYKSLLLQYERLEVPEVLEVPDDNALQGT
jgi:hypothetical protein